MGLWDWFGRRGPREDARLQAWKREWQAAMLTLDPAAAPGLRDTLEALGLPEDDIEIEREMLAALDDAAALAAEIRRAGLPIVPTGHRVVGHDRCHFSAAASMPDEPGQPSGRLLLTSQRAVFAGGSQAVSSPWHMIAEARQHDRDLLLVRTTRDRVYGFRCNSFSEAARAALIGRALLGRRPA